jgi:hypothetical protein
MLVPNNSKIAISQKPLQITITIAGIRGITVRRMLDGLLMQPKKQRTMTTYQNNYYVSELNKSQENNTDSIIAF